jgi:WD40 repeat protein
MDSTSLFVHTLGGGAPQVVTTNIYNYLLSVSPTAVNGNVGIAVVGTDGYAAVYSLGPTFTVGTPVVLDVTADPVPSAAFSPNGALLAVGDYDAVTRFWTYPVASATTLPTGANIVIDPTSQQIVRGLAFSPNGSYLAVAGGYSGDVSIWDVASRSELHRTAVPGSPPNDALSIAFSPSGNAIVVGERGCGKVLLCTE